MKNTCTIDGTTYEVEYAIHGRHEPQTLEHPGATPEVEILDATPELPDNVDHAEVEEACREDAKQRDEPDPPAPNPEPPGAHDIPPGYDGR